MQNVLIGLAIALVIVVVLGGLWLKNSAKARQSIKDRLKSEIDKVK